MANYGLFRENKFSDIIIPLLEKFNNVNSRGANLFELHVAHAILTGSIQRWGSLQDREAIAPGVETISFSDDIIGTLIGEARLAGLPNPYTADMKALEKRTKVLGFGETNAWLDWVGAVKFFRENTIEKLSAVLGTKYEGYYDSVQALLVHPDATVYGLTLADNTLSEGNLLSFDIDASGADAVALKDKYFIITDNAGLTHMLYFELDAIGGFVPPVVTDTVTAITVTTGLSTVNIAKAIGQALDTLLVGTTNLNKSTVTFQFSGVAPTNAYDKATSVTGISYDVFDELVASDDTVLATGILDAVEYAEKHNTLRVPYEKSIGSDVFYIEAVADSRGYNFYSYAADPKEGYNKPGVGDAGADLTPKAARDAYPTAVNNTNKKNTTDTTTGGVGGGATSVLP